MNIKINKIGKRLKSVKYGTRTYLINKTFKTYDDLELAISDLEYRLKCNQPLYLKV